MHDYAEQLVALRPMLVRMAHQRLRNDAWVEDAVSDTLVAALENASGFAGRAQLRTWVVGILKHKLVDQIRRHTRECQMHESADAEEFDVAHAADAADGAPEAPADWGDPQERLSRRQFMTQFEQVIRQLPAQQGRAFVMRNWMEAETEDICSELGVTANHLAVILHRARQRLRGALRIHALPTGTALARAA
ncbi:MAG: sigma-70 family RNA polymerase sigma factor [Piscinibacter sp.]